MVSEDNVELQRRMIDAFNVGDIDEFIRFTDPSVEMHSAFAAIGGAVYRGHDGLRQWQKDFEGTWGDDVWVEVETYFDLGDDVLVHFVLHGQGLQGGMPAAMPSALAATWRNGAILSFKVFAHREDALAELGLSEDELVPIAP